MDKFIAKIKRQESPFFRFLYGFGKKVLTFNMPVSFANRWFFILILKTYYIIRALYRYLKQKLFVEPTTKSIIEVGKKVHIEEVPAIGGAGEVFLGSNSHVSGNFIISFVNKYNNNPTLHIGNDTFIGHMTRMTIAASVSIGKHVYLGATCMILDNDGHPINHLDRRNKRPVEKDKIQPVVIEDDVWIGNGVIILKGVTIGARSIIAARSVVTKSIPPDSVAGGNPCRILRSMTS